ncbi:MAG TPA: hemerythrin domain-containing protein [Polyangiaceae bacterium]|jgi:hemerythrin-like domain-containing protein
MTDEGTGATIVLSKQHRSIQSKIDALLDELRNERPTIPIASLVSRLGEELLAHLAVEEAIFYPAARRALAGHDGEDGRHDHLLVRLRLRGVLKGSVTGESLTEPVLALRRAFARHVHLEETKVFPHVERELTAPVLTALGALLSVKPTIRTVEPGSTSDPRGVRARRVA